MHNPKFTSDIMNKIPAYFDFLLIAAIVAFMSAVFGLRVFEIWNLDLQPLISLDISIPRNLEQVNIVHESFIIMIDLTL